MRLWSTDDHFSTSANHEPDLILVAVPANHPREQIDFGVARASTVHVMLAVVGDLLEDVVVRTVTPPAVGTDTPARIERRPGGSAANVAAAAGRLGAAVRLICRVGADALGEQLVASA